MSADRASVIPGTFAAGAADAAASGQSDVLSPAFEKFYGIYK